MVGLLALLAEGPDETLGQDAQESIGEIERVDPHVEEADDGFRGAVRVERAEDEMARQRRLDAGLGRFEIPHLAHHDHVRVGPEEGAHGGGEVEADLRLDLDLAESVLGDFHGVLGRPDLPVRRVDLVEGGVQGGRLAGAGGADDEDHPVGLVQDGPKFLEIAGRHPHRGEGQGIPGLGQDPHHDILHPSLGRDGGHAEFDLLAARLPELDLAVLGEAPDGDIEIRHDLDAGDDRRAVAVGEGLIDGAVAVDPVADLDVLFPDVGFDVDIGGAFGLGVEDDLVDELHDHAVRFGDDISSSSSCGCSSSSSLPRISVMDDSSSGD